MKNIDRLTQLNVEIEGLLHVLAKRDSSDIRQLLGDKFTEFTALFNGLLSGSDIPESTVEKTTEDVAETLTQDEVKNQEAVSDEVIDEDEAATEAIERGQEHHDLTTGTDLYVTMHTPLEDNEASAPSSEDVLDEAPDTLAPDTLAPDTLPSDTLSPDIRVDEMLSRRGATDLKRVFTINDKFRFRRELFNQNDGAFAKALEDLSALDTFAQANEYVTANLGLSPENPAVEDFLNIIKPHYRQ